MIKKKSATRKRKPSRKKARKAPEVLWVGQRDRETSAAELKLLNQLNIAQAHLQRMGDISSELQRVRVDLQELENLQIRERSQFRRKIQLLQSVLQKRYHGDEPLKDALYRMSVDFDDIHGRRFRAVKLSDLLSLFFPSEQLTGDTPEDLQAFARLDGDL